MTRLNRRGFLKTGAAASAMALAAPGIARAAGYPERNIKVIIPTREGGGADRNFRAFSSVWSQKLGTEFEPGFFPGASGRVGYEVYMGKEEPDAYSLIFGNMGPEVLNWAMQAPESFSVEDYFYFGRVDVDPGCLFVGAESPLQTMDDIIAEGKKRVLNVGTSRMAHPASIGLLALGDETGAQFNLIPLSGGKNTVAGAVTGEVDFSVLTSGSVIAAGDAVKTLLVFGENRVGEALDNAPSMNDAYGTNLPEMLSSRAFAIHKKAADDHPDRFEVLARTFRETFDDPALLEAYVATGGTPEYLSYGGVEECAAFMQAMLELGARYKPLLTGA
ncbi:tripartite tricarboxylate transporter substrate-binding protein [Ovoidimarina sediminis]|uniref:tripartite tricarboxylate transporter substrate-binding protein n=1 Tax=Ovoidimarina sediminis TaxID=3079856 RepID=UPI00290DC7E7|nr:tripartite tricarboxylate transporter substrate-binding protein [Rhodophyticola sp. MJ-SS7]MDU8944755.1 tripartite tricarboxylate transporter substrate-binding protein [Rhodophyticola sp. MJ-SS7]